MDPNPDREDATGTPAPASRLFVQFRNGEPELVESHGDGPPEAVRSFTVRADGMTIGLAGELTDAYRLEPEPELEPGLWTWRPGLHPKGLVIGFRQCATGLTVVAHIRRRPKAEPDRIIDHEPTPSDAPAAD